MTTKLTDKNISNVANLGIQWQAVITADGSTTTTAVAGRGYLIDTTSNAHTINLPASAIAGDTIAIKDYAATFGTNNLTISRNGNNIQGVANDSVISTNRASVELIYVDSTKGWVYTNESNVAVLGPTFITATGGTITTSGDFKIHTFTGDGCFVVSCGGNPAGSDSVDYLVVAGGGGGGNKRAGGGGAGGLRIGAVTPSPCHSPLVTTGLSVSATTYPITVGGGGAGAGNPVGSNGSNSVFSTITSAGGGGGANGDANACGVAGGSGGGGGRDSGTPGSPTSSGAGNTPPVSPPQGNPGGGTLCAAGPEGGGGGGGATAAGSLQPADRTGGPGGAGLNVSPVFGTAPQPFYLSNTPNTGNTACGQFAGGGGGGGTPSGGPASNGGVGGGAGGSYGTNPIVAGATNSGGGGGGGGCGPIGGTAGGKGIVIIRYKYQ